VPVDDKNMIIFGWRHFNEEIDPEGLGRPEDCGVDKIDFLVGQTGNRTYEEGQRAPGDWEVICSQRPIAVHRLEHAGRSDVGVMMYRQLLRRAVAGKTAADTSYHPEAGESIHQYAQDSLIRVPKKEGRDDGELLGELNRKLLSIIVEGNAVPPNRRDEHIRRRLDDLEQEMAGG
jgi:hypothetical protein